MKYLGLIALTGVLCAVRVSAAQGHQARGLVLSVDPSHNSVVISCAAIPDYMDAMPMEFTVRETKVLGALRPGTMVDFTMVQSGQNWYADDLRPRAAQNFESEPMEAGRLTTLTDALDPAAAARVVAAGQQVPDFSLADQKQKKIELSGLHGKVVAISFAYSRCPNPNYCFRLSNNLAEVAKRFHPRLGSDLVLLTVMMDPEHDNGKALSDYAGQWNADPSVWHFLSGSVADVRQVAGLFGMNFWNAEGLLTHPLHTVVIDRQGKLAVNLEGNEFTATQFGDLIQTILDALPGHQQDMRDNPFPGEPPDDFYAGGYSVIGQQPHEGLPYKGRAHIEVKDHRIRLSRTIKGKTTVVEGKFVAGGESKKKCLEFEWKDKRGSAEMFCQYSVDFDNYARLSCTWSYGRLRKGGRPGFESYFPSGAGLK